MGSSHISFNEVGHVIALAEDEQEDLFRDLERSRRQLKRQIEEATREPGKVLGRFVLIQTVEKNSVGGLHQAWDQKDQRFVALRTIDDIGTLGREAHRLLETATLMRHPSIMAPLQGGFGVSSDGRLFIAMEVSAGRTLEPRRGEQLRREPEAAVKIVRDIAKGLTYAQGLGLGHGALHPASILVDSRGNAKLLDITVPEIEAACAARKDKLVQRLERAGLRPPELAAGEAGDTLADVWAMGALMLRLIADKGPKFLRPFEEGTDPSLPATLDPVIRRCIDPNPRVRYGSPCALARDLDRWLEGQRPEACDLPLGRRLARGWHSVQTTVGKLTQKLQSLKKDGSVSA
jgi:eukaryotic-like serine/threonine-protein kinase